MSGQAPQHPSKMNARGTSGVKDGAARIDPARSRLSPSEFSALYMEHGRTLWCVAVAILRDRTAALDALQESAVIAMQKLDEFNPQTSFRAWMAQIVRFVALNEARKRTRHAESLRTHSPGSGVHEDRPPASDPPVDGAIARALDALPEIARACLLLRAVEGLSYKQIAAALDIPEGTAMSHVFRARAALRNALAPEGFGPRPGGGA